ncbi:MAG TPA: nuclear transport factor 2 family protein [Candidatus Angelobacter sp.]|jgi:ketosteroid isomerase-like protein
MITKVKTTILLLLALAVGLPAAAQLTPVSGDQRQKDRDAIRAHIDSIFQAYMHKDRGKIQATHSQQWRGFLTPSREIIRGLDEYMQYADRNLKGGTFQDYKILDFDVMFYNDVAIVPYIARIGDENSPYKLRVLDIYARLNGDWIQVGSYTALHPDTQTYFQEQLVELPSQAKQQLLLAREAVWRDFFANNRARLEQTIPAETIAINPGQKDWDGREQVLSGAKGFADSGGKLKRLEFPRTDIQVYGNVALLYSKYLYETENGGKSEEHTGRATEMFVNRDGKWVNVGWHMDSEP